MSELDSADEYDILAISRLLRLLLDNGQDIGSLCWTSSSTRPMLRGGVHSDEPRDNRAAAAQAMNSAFTIGGYTVTLGQLQAIGRVVARGLSELRERVAAANPDGA